MFWNASNVASAKELKAGDLIGFSGADLCGDFVNLMTWGIPRYSCSHVAIIGEYNGRLLLFESTTLCEYPCVIQGKPFRGSQAHEIDSRIKSYRGKVWHYPLYRSLYPQENARLSEYLVSKIGIPYDTFGAARSGAIVWLAESLFNEPDMSMIFCSEMCGDAWREVGILETANASKWNPNHLLRYSRWRGLTTKRRRFCEESFAS